MINFAALEEDIGTCAKQQVEMGSSLGRLETTVATLASKAEVDAMETRLKEQLSKASRALERLDMAQQAASQVVQEMPSIQRELTARMSDLEQKLSAEVSNLSQTLGARVGAAESELRNKASKSDLSKIKIELEDCVRREHVDKLQTLINKVRDEASDRIDGLAERTLNMRRDLDGALDQMTKTTEQIQKRVDERTAALEEQANEVSNFLAKAERQIGSKVSNEELTRVVKSFSEQLQEMRNVLQAQMDVVRGRVERSTEDFQRVVGTMDAVAMRTEVQPIADNVKKLQSDLMALGGDVETKAAEEDVAAKLEEIMGVQDDHRTQLLTKADAVTVTEKHERHVLESTNALNGLREVTEHLGISINSVEESVNLVAAQTQTKAETRDVHEMMRMNEAVQTQIASLKAELQGTLKALETWILEQNTKKSHGMKLQPKPAGAAAPATARSARPSEGPPATAASHFPDASEEKLQHRVGELERQLAETQALLYAQTGAPGMHGVRGAGDSPFPGGFAAPAGIPGGKLDASGAFMMPGETGQALSPRPPLRKKGGGPGSHAASESGEVAAPPFRSQSDRRQWLLQEKRRWLVEMRLGGGGNPAEASIPAPTPSKLPPIPAGGAALSNGIDLATIATPR